ncbi:MAG: hypothetical protein H7Y04_09005, partial [Verrucomicrobia bacterium]|nr:hypothetical protein [Cytophagales bacterium]
MSISSEKIANFIDSCKKSEYPDGFDDPQTETFKTLKSIEDYLSGKSKKIPVIDYYGWFFLRELLKIVNLPTQWTNEDDNIFQIFARKGTWTSKANNWDEGQGSKEFTDWLNTLLTEDETKNTELLHWFLDLMDKNKLPVEELLLYITKDEDSDFDFINSTSEYNETQEEYNTIYHGIAFVGRLILHFVPEKANDFVSNAKKYDNQEKFFELFARADKKLIFEYGEDLVEANTSYNNAAILLQIDAKVYEDFVLKLMEKPYSKDFRHHFYHHLYVNLPEKYKETYLSDCYETVKERNGFSGDWNDFMEERLDFMLKNDRENMALFLTDFLSKSALLQ